MCCLELLDCPAVTGFRILDHDDLLLARDLIGEANLIGDRLALTENAHFILSSDQACVKVRGLGKRRVMARCPVILNLWHHDLL